MAAREHTAGGKRRERVSDLLQREIANIISEGNVRDRRVSHAVITHVSLSGDMSHAKIFFTHMKGGSPDAMSEAFGKLSGFFRREVASRLNMRKVPSLEFSPDDVADSARRVDEIIRREGG
ncbi:MAG: 30S ribosome-binding factor RbfA [Candidatus Dadabacteria bacterium]|nr:30S ribosome-binding factor RbfA [Candidatus Dadabacteria bacterium]